jgi:hypothetical protein
VRGTSLPVSYSLNVRRLHSFSCFITAGVT